MKKLITLVLLLITVISYSQTCRVGLIIDDEIKFFEYDCKNDKYVDSVKIANFDFISAPELHQLDLLIVKYVNNHRVKYGLPALLWDNKLYKITKSHTDYQFDNGVVEHEQNGKSFLERIRENGVSMGECVLLSGGAGSTLDNKAKKIVGQWIDSPTHNRILLDKKAKSISVSTKLGVFYCSWDNDKLYLGCGVSTLNVRY
jgi:uncharacterized protein YkwD